MAETSASTKLLILDTGHLSTDPRMGMLLNEFPQLVAAKVEASQQPQLWVLISNDQHQRSNVAARTQRTAFGHFVARGLEGEADLDRDGLIDLKEFDNYVRDHVAGWVDAAPGRHETQTPRLCWGGEQTGKKKSFPVLGTVQRKAPTSKEDEKKEEGEGKQTHRVLPRGSNGGLATIAGRANSWAGLPILAVLPAGTETPAGENKADPPPTSATDGTKPAEDEKETTGSAPPDAAGANPAKPNPPEQKRDKIRRRSHSRRENATRQ